MVKNRHVLLLAMLMVTGSMGVSGMAAGGPAGRTADNDNDFASATALTSGVKVTGDVNDTDDLSDYYKVNVLSGQTLSVNFSFTCSSNFIQLTVYDGNQALLGSIQTGFILLAAQNDTIYIDVNTLFGSDSYDLTAIVEYPPTMTPGVQIKAHLDYIDSSQFTRYWRLWLNGNVSGKSEAVWVNMTEPAGTDFDLYAMDILNSKKSDRYNFTILDSPNERMTFAASYTGWYYVQASAYDGAGDVTVDITKFTVNSDGDNDNVNGTKVRHNAVINNSVDQGADHYDWYKYHVLAGDTLTVKVDKTAGTDVFNVSVYATNMSFIAGAFNFAAGQSTPSATVSVTAAAQDTTYLVSVSAIQAIRGGSQTDDTAFVPYKLTFTSTNHVPQVLSSFDDMALDEDTTVSVPAAAHFSDVDEDQLAFSATGGTNVALTYNASSGNLDVVPAANWHGAETVTVTADDGFGGKTPLTINVTVRPVNDVPFVKKKITDIKMLQGGTDISVDLSKVFYDNDIPWGDALNYTVEGNGSLRVTVGSDGKVTIVDPIEFYGQVNMQFSAADGEGASALAPCNITVQHVNQPPRVKANPGNLSVDEDGTATLDMSGAFSDLDGDPITLLASGQTRITVLIDPDTLVVTFKPSPNLSGFYEDVKFTAQDDKGLGDFFVVVRVTVVVVNDPPVIKSASPVGTVTLTETDGEEFSVTVATVETWDTFNYTWFWDDKDLLWNENSYPLKTDFTSAGSHVLRVVVDDGTDSVERSWNVSVINKNREPTDVKISSPRTGESFKQAAEIEFTASAKDPDGDTLSWSWLEGRKELSTEKGFTTTTLSPGTHNIVLEASDGTATARSKPITITIDPNLPPRITSLLPLTGQTFTTGKKIDFSVTANDLEDNPLTYKWSEDATVLSTQPAFSTSGLKEGTHNIQLSIYDGYGYTNQSLAVEVLAPAQPAPIGGMALYYALAAVAIIAVVATVAVMALRRKKPGAPAAETVSPPADNQAALNQQYNPAPQEKQQPAASAYDYGANQPPAAAPEDQYQYSPEAGISDAQPGGASLQPAWASGPAYQSPEAPPAPESAPSAPAVEPAPSEPVPAEPPADENK